MHSSTTEVGTARGRIDAMPLSRMHERYQKEVLPWLQKEMGYANRMAAPRLVKIVLNMGIGEAITNIKALDAAVAELGQITGQKAIVTRAKKSIANFKLRKNMQIGRASCRERGEIS